MKKNAAPVKPSKPAKPAKATKSPVRAGATAKNKPATASEKPSVKPSAKPPKAAIARPQACRIIAVCNQKGGCGKTTTVINIAAGLASLGQRVLVVDLDSQCNATSGLGIDPDEVDKTTFDLLVDPKGSPPDDVIVETPYENLHLAPASLELSEFESRIASEIGRENRLKKALAQVAPLYDYVLIDTPPSLGLLSVNALNAANEVHIAMQAHPFAFDGLTLLLGTIKLIQEELNPSLKISGIVVTMFDPRTKISREIVERVCAMDGLQEQVYATVVRQNVKLTEASKVRKPVMYYDAACFGTEDYLALSREVALRAHAPLLQPQPQQRGDSKKSSQTSTTRP